MGGPSRSPVRLRPGTRNASLSPSHCSTPGKGELESDRWALKGLPSYAGGGEGGRNFLPHLSVGNEVSLCRFKMAFPFLGLS